MIAGTLLGLLVAVLAVLAGSLLLDQAGAAVLTPYEDGDAFYTVLADGSIQLPAAPTTARAVKLWRNGLRQKFGADYKINAGNPRVLVPIGWRASAEDVFVIDYWRF